ncbi:hypothetical protein B7L88_gp050 [Rhizobium phage RHEph10]|uniref:hypothetical protein n=1 Tax=Rhizobium phage RHEph10 TaxID=1220717 RepID=UPI0002AB20FD|nr:hypothetical protein B7L88_gp050 [Rhizobium phage RHEph10]AGC36094.1 hypothetical protein RHEph10_gp050 [Rhizobium phage RHEph10]
MKFSLEDFLASLRKLFGREQSVDNILKPITKITNKLAKHERVQNRERTRRLEAAERARNAAIAAEAAARRAAEKRSKILDTFA